MEALNPGKYHYFCRTVILDLLVLQEANSSINFAATNNGKDILLVNSNKSGLVYRLEQSCCIHLMNADEVIFS